MQTSDTPDWSLRSEQPQDADAVDSLLRRAFAPSDGEAQLVRALRANDKLTCTRVVTHGERVVAYVALSAVRVVGDDAEQQEHNDQVKVGWGLAPVAVDPEFQGRGVGSRLMRDVLEESLGKVPFVVLLGDPRFYARFGFKTSTEVGLRCVYEVPEEAFQVVLAGGVEREQLPRGVVHYEAEFDAVTPTPGVLLVLDFDWSLVNENTDTYIFKKLAPDLYDEIAEARKAEPSWTRLMDSLVRRLCARGVGREQFDAALRGFPIFEELVEAVRLAASQPHVEAIILSDANAYYIDTILRDLGLADAFPAERIITNTGAWDESGCLSIGPFQPWDTPHGCERCPLNLCKGRELDAWLSKRAEPYERVVYLGDGGGDFCPAVQSLRAQDVVLARSGYSLLNKCVAHQEQVKAQVVEWADGAQAAAAITKFTAA